MTYNVYISREKGQIKFANSGDPDQMPHSTTSDVGQHCLSITF